MFLDSFLYYYNVKSCRKVVLIGTFIVPHMCLRRQNVHFSAAYFRCVEHLLIYLNTPQAMLRYINIMKRPNENYFGEVDFITVL